MVQISVASGACPEAQAIDRPSSRESRDSRGALLNTDVRPGLMERSCDLNWTFSCAVDNSSCVGPRGLPEPANAIATTFMANNRVV